MRARLLPESIKIADDGSVSVVFESGDTKIRGSIGQNFFSDFSGIAQNKPHKKLQIVRDNAQFFEDRALTQIAFGRVSVSIE